METAARTIRNAKLGNRVPPAPPAGAEAVSVGGRPPLVPGADPEFDVGAVEEAARTWFVMLAEQITSAPPPLAEPLHWLIRTLTLDDFEPDAVHFSPTRVPPLADPLHCVIVAPVVVAGNGSQPVVMPPPDPTHWFLVALDEPGLTPTKLFVTRTLQRNVPPPPLIESLHWLTLVTSRFMFQCVVLHDACGSPAAPWHSRTVVLDDPPALVIVLMMLTWQISPRPPLLSTPLLHVVVAATLVAADAVPDVPSEVAVSSPNANRPETRNERERRMATPRGGRASWPMGSATGGPCPDYGAPFDRA